MNDQENKTQPETVHEQYMEKASETKNVSEIQLDMTEALLEQARQMIKSKLLPDSIQTPEGAVVVMQYGRELGFQPMAAFQNIYIVNGKPSLATKAIAGLLLRGGVKWRIDKDFEEVWADEARTQLIDRVTKMTFFRDGMEISMEFKWSDAVTAKLVGKGVWKTYPKNMMYWRCFSMAADRIAPDLLLGMADSSVMADVHNIPYECNENGSVKIMQKQ